MPNTPASPSRVTTNATDDAKWGSQQSNYALHVKTGESNVYQRTVDYPDEWHNGFHVMLDSEKLVTVRWEQVAGLR